MKKVLLSALAKWFAILPLLCMSVGVRAEFTEGIFRYEVIQGTSDKLAVCGFAWDITPPEIAAIPGSLTYRDKLYTVTRIDVESFKGTTTLTEVKLPGTIESIGFQAFNGCSNLKSINLPKSLQHIYYGAFANCTSLTHVDFPEKLSDLSQYAFANSGLVEADLSRTSFTEFEYEVFKDCANLQLVKLPGGVKSISYRMFYNCPSLSEINLPEGLESINAGAFDFCGSLKNISFPESLVTIEECAFRCCGLEQVTIPPSVATVGHWAFKMNPDLHTVILADGSQPLSIVEDIWDEGSVDSDYSEYYKSNFDNVTDLYVGRPIAGNPFVGCSSLINLRFGPGITEIADEAFMGCKSLKNIEFSPSVTTIGTRAFAYCHGLTAIDLTDNIVSVGAETFKMCRLLSSVKFSSGIAEISERMFYWCEQLKHIVIPSGVTTIGAKAFSESALESVKLPESLVSIGDEAFYDTKLRTLEIPAGLRSIGDYAFYNCYSLMRVKTDALTPPVIQRYTFGDKTKGYPLYVPSLAFDEYSATQYWKDFSNMQSDDSDIKVWLIEFATDERTIKLHENLLLTTRVYPEFATNTVLEWSSSDETVVTVDNTGLVTAVGVGEAVITCKTTDGTGIMTSCDVTVPAENILPANDMVASGRYFITTKRSAYGKYLGVDGAVLTRKDIPDSSCSWDIEALDGNKCYIRNHETGKYLMSADCSLTSAVPVELYLFMGNAALGICRENDPDSRLFLNAYKTESACTAWSYDAGSSWAFEPYSAPVKAEAIALNHSTFALAESEQVKLIATLSPDNVTDKSIIWTSSNPAVATVNSEGVVTAVRAGQATVTATTADGSNLSATCDVTVKAPVILAEGIIIDSKEVHVRLDDAIYANFVEVLPGNATTHQVMLSNDNPDVVSIEPDGLCYGPIEIHGKKPGSAKITVSTIDGSNLSSFFMIYVEGPDVVQAQVIAFTEEAVTCPKDKSVTLRVDFTPDNVTTKKLEWSSADESIATVDASGNVTGHNLGKTTITATTTDDSNLSATCEVTVISLTAFADSYECEVGEERQFYAVIEPDNATYQNIDWHSDNEAVAIVDNNGLAKAVGVGQATITAYAFDSGMSASCILTVSDPSSIADIYKRVPSELEIYDLVGRRVVNPQHNGIYLINGKLIKWCKPNTISE